MYKHEEHRVLETVEAHSCLVLDSCWICSQIQCQMVLAGVNSDVIVGDERKPKAEDAAWDKQVVDC